ncbi:Quinolinate synthase [Pseudolycoriella hygida]|uniref:quinolinate synthase n=1 Tax=Pseudolycoriella hygida TaxID=35572 RepID=A0A9Q0S4D6_9DIPT|nr:Quinolinate synthase [Pseudolycoriella hygida]
MIYKIAEKFLGPNNVLPFLDQHIKGGYIRKGELDFNLDSNSLANVIPETAIKDIDPYLDLEQEIIRLKAQKNAIILAHYYQYSEIQDIADFIGDSLELSKKAAMTSADIIVFCGVKFMAEAAYILNPDKKVLLPDIKAGCSLEESCTAEEFRKFREENPEYIAITYINCSAAVKALSDVIVTSSSAEKIINSIAEDRPILFAPDKHLGNFLIKKTNRPMKLWNGSCIVHENFSERELIKIQASNPTAQIIAHPECPAGLLRYADYVGSTSALLKYVETCNNSKEFIVLTEPGIIHQMQIKRPDSEFHEVPSINQAGCSSCSNCPHMKLNTLEKLYLCMVNESPEIKLPDEITIKARLSLERMLELSK